MRKCKFEIGDVVVCVEDDNLRQFPNLRVGEKYVIGAIKTTDEEVYVVLLGDCLHWREQRFKKI